jgi:alkanesulfonate monooxygenase SsuD/methylene tetrahydromethanopterin reductase-like flavin-dependent oxidoreductase (luciferase family)
MEFFAFTEMPYPDVPEEYWNSARVTLPNGLYDPKRGHEQYNRYLDLHEYADELGLNIMLNEHHQTMTCLDSTIGPTAGALVRRTKRAKILLLGNMLPQREEPVRVAEEVAMLDVISGGRILSGFVRGVATEMHPANANPVYNRERFYEAMDLIIKAWTTPEPFAWEGKHYQYRYVNVWPQPYQKPYPPVWITGTSMDETAHYAADHDFTHAILFVTWQEAARLFEVNRARCRAIGKPEPTADKFAYVTMLFVGETDEQAQRDGEALYWYFRQRPARGFQFPPGHGGLESTVRAWSAPGAAAADGSRRLARNATWEEVQQSGAAVVGSPTTVLKRLRELYDLTGIGNLCAMTHVGPMSNELSMRSLKLFADEVYPALQAFGPRTEEYVAAARTAGAGSS